MNKGLSEKLIKVYPGLIPKEISTLETINIKNDNFLSGFSDAEGCFECVIRKHPTVKIGYQVAVRFTLAQHLRDFMLIQVIKDHFKCGMVRKDLKKPYVTWVVVDIIDIVNIIIPFFDNYPLLGNKLSDYEYFRKIAFLGFSEYGSPPPLFGGATTRPKTQKVKNKHHLTQDGFNEIIDLKSKMKR